MTDRRIVPFQHWHYRWIVDKETEGPTLGYIRSESLRPFEGPTSWTAIVDGEPVAAAGTVKQWPGRHLAWSFMNLESGPHMLWITRAVTRALDTVAGRIEMTVRKDFAAGHRWAKLLGFDVETPLLKAYGPFGEDHVGYWRFN